MEKILINAFIILLLVFWLSGISFSFPPLRIKFTHWYMALGIILVIIGIFLIYYDGHLNPNNNQIK